MRIKTASDTIEADYNLAKILDSPGGFEKVALEQLPPYIRDTRDYEGFCRKLLVTHNVTDKDIYMINNEPYVYYAKDLNSHAAFYGDDGEIPRMQIEGEGVNVGITTISSDDTTINLKRLLVQRFNYLDRVRELSGQAIAKVEDNKFLALAEAVLKGPGTDKAPTYDSQIVTTADTMLGKIHLVNLKRTQSQHNIPTAAFLMNQARLEDILIWAQEEIDQLTQREMLESGVRYAIWGTKIVTSPIINMNVVYSFSDPDIVGRMPILKDLTVKLTEVANKLEKGLFMFEFLGFFMASHKAVGKLILGFTSGDNKIDTTLLGKEDSLAKTEEISASYGAL